MSLPHLLRVERPPEDFAELFAAAAEAGLRIGWLEAADPEPPPSLAAAAGLGALRAVAVGEAGTLAYKPRRGPAVLADLLREHFAGCALVLVHGDIADAAGASYLEPPHDPDAGWRLVTREGDHPLATLQDDRPLTTDSLVARLRRPRLR